MTLLLDKLPNAPRRRAVLVAACAASLLIGLPSPAQAQTSSVSVTEAGTANGYGDFGGLAIDFDPTLGLSADWAPDLLGEALYSVDTVSVFNRGSSNNTPFYLGVYSSLIENNGFGTELGGFLGASDNTVVMSGAPGIRTWDFTAGTNIPGGGDLEVVSGVVPGNGFTAADDDTIPFGTTLSGDGLYFFVLQDVPTAVTGLIDAMNANAIERIDGDSGSLDDELAGVLHGGNINTLKLDRAPEYQATVTLLDPGPIKDIDLTLQVNPVTGATRVLSSETDPVEIEFYQIESNDGSLSVGGWQSVDDSEGADPPGSGWVEAGGSNTNILGEGSLTSSLVFNENKFLELGAAFTPGSTQDLVFSVGLNGGTELLEGPVEYVEWTPLLEADFDQDGDVDDVDLAKWQSSSAALDGGGDTDLDGDSDLSDLLRWQRQVGTTASVAAVSTVPEPATWVLLLGSTALAHRRNRS